MEEGLVSFKVLHRSAYFLPSFALYGVSSEGRVVAKSILLFTTSSSFFFLRSNYLYLIELVLEKFLCLLS